jgi:hypothetical protein
VRHHTVVGCFSVSYDRCTARRGRDQFDLKAAWLIPVPPFFLTKPNPLIAGMARFGLSIEFEKKTLQLWEQRFERDISGAFVRADKWTKDTIAKNAVDAFRKEAHKHIDRPKAWTLRGIRYRRSVYVGDADGQSSSIYMLDDRSAVLKYLMGQRGACPVMSAHRLIILPCRVRRTWRKPGSGSIRTATSAAQLYSGCVVRQVSRLPHRHQTHARDGGLPLPT